MDYSIRPLKAEDQSIIWEMLQYAAHESSLQAVQEQPCLAIYAQNWGKNDDLGYIAEHDGQGIGMVWIRLWSSKTKGYGYLSDHIPELAIAVLPDYRGQGIGTNLLTKILEIAQNRFSGISLSVRANNPAVGLYERVGFIKVANSEVINRVSGESFKMLYQFI